MAATTLLRRAAGAIVLVNLLGAPGLAAQHAADAPQPDSLAARSSGEAEIIVEGQRRNERYRIAPELRSLPRARDMRAQSIDPRLACQAVGPYGCGPPLMRIVTVSGDGSIRVGSSGEE